MSKMAKETSLNGVPDYGYGYGLWGSWIPLVVPRSSTLLSVLLVVCSLITSTTFGYDGSMLNGLNILPSYLSYFDLNDVTIGLSTASVWIGGCLAGVTFGGVTDAIGRRPALLLAAIITIIAVILQAAAQNIAMFVIARILIGLGTSASGLTGPTYLAETLPYKWRAWGLGIFNDFYYVGGLVAAGVTYGTSFMLSTWAWRIPSLVQGVFSILCIVIIPFIPESPRWLAWKGRNEACMRVLAQMHADGDEEAEVVKVQYRQLVESMEWEKSMEDTKLSVKQMIKRPNSRKRVLLACSAALFSTVAGNVIASYYLGSMLDNAGITNTTTQLQINIILNAFCLLCSLGGTYLADHWGRKPITVTSQLFLTIFIFMIGALTKVYGTSENKHGVYGTVAAIFLFQGAYSIGWTPILYLYPPEVLNYSIRANGMGVFQFVLNGAALLFVFVMPIALASVGWKTYMMNGAWDVVILIIIQLWWVETKGRTLEELDEALDGKRHFDEEVPHLDAVVGGQAGKGTGEVEEVDRKDSEGDEK